MEKPSIDELEDILDGKADVDIELLPNGEVVERSPAAARNEIFEECALIASAMIVEIADRPRPEDEDEALVDHVMCQTLKKVAEKIRAKKTTT